MITEPHSCQYVSDLISICILVCAFVLTYIWNTISHCPSTVNLSVDLKSVFSQVWPKYLQTFFSIFYFAQSALFQPALCESVELKVPPGENCWTRGVSPLPYIAVLARKCLTLTDQYFRKLLLVSLPISQADNDVIAACVCVRIRGLS